LRDPPCPADNEASNVSHVAAGPYGRCYAKSVPDHLYDPVDEPRQQGRTNAILIDMTNRAAAMLKKSPKAWILSRGDANSFPALPVSLGFEREGAGYVDFPALGIFGHKREFASDA
jgi:hypothetical protein